MSRGSVLRLVGSLLAGSVVLAGCGDARAGRAGGDEAEPEPTVLTFSNPYNTDTFPSVGRSTRPRWRSSAAARSASS